LVLRVVQSHLDAASVSPRSYLTNDIIVPLLVTRSLAVGAVAALRLWCINASAGHGLNQSPIARLESSNPQSSSFVRLRTAARIGQECDLGGWWPIRKLQ